MIISLALLGYGASGAVLTLAQRAVHQRFAPLFSAAAAAFGVSAIGCFLLAQRVPFNPLEILWDPRQPLYLLAVYLLLALPFLCAGACVCMAFSRWRGKVSRIYSFDILGAGAGSLGIVALLFVLSPQDALKLIGALGWAAAAVAWLECGRPRGWPAAALMVMAGLPFLLPESWVAPAMSPYKELSQTLRIPEARVVEQRSSPLGLVSVVESPRIPLRHAPGLSLNASAEPPPQLGVFIDGEGMSALTRFDGRRESLAHLGQMTSALPYHLLRQPRVLVLGAGAGADVLQAHYHGGPQIDAVELNPQVVDLVRRRFADYAGGIYSTIARVHVAEARGFVAASEERYDLIHVALLDSFSASSAGLYALSGELPLHGRSPAGRSAASGARRPAGDHALGHAAAARRAQAVCRGGGGAGAIGRRRSRVPARPGAQLEDQHAARQERRLRQRGHRGHQGLLRRPLVRRGVLSRYPAGGSEPLQRGRASRPVRRCYGAAGSGSGRIPAELQVPHRPSHRRQAAFLPFLQVALAARALVAEGARRVAAAGMGLSGARGDACSSGGREPAVDRSTCGLGHVGRRPAGASVPPPDRAAASSSTFWRSASASCSSRLRSSRSSSCF